MENFQIFEANDRIWNYAALITICTFRLSIAGSPLLFPSVGLQTSDTLEVIVPLLDMNNVSPVAYSQCRSSVM